MRKVAIPSLAVAALFTFAACGSDDMDDAEDEIDSLATNLDNAVDEASEDAIESAARNIASEAGAEEFADAGYELDGELACEATALEDELSKIEISCTGVAAAGGDAAMTGATNEMPGEDLDSLEGLFKGTVDGNEVFATDQLGD